jgi:hypothetical protein
MKCLLLLLFFGIGIQGWISAQTRDTTSSQDPGYQSSPAGSSASQKKVSPAQKAARQLAVLQDKLNLNKDQVIQLRMILLNTNISLDSLRSDSGGDKKMENQARRTILQSADLKTYALLNTDQQLLYAQWKKQQKQQQQQKAMERRLNATADSTAVKH